MTVTDVRPAAPKATTRTDHRSAATPRGVILIGLIVTVGATILAFPFEPLDAEAWTGLFFLISALALLPAALLLAVQAGRSQQDLAAVGFGAIALYGLGTTLDASLLARGLPDVSVGFLPGMWGVLALGLLFVGLSGRFPAWVRSVGLASAAGHGVATVAVLFGAEMPPTGADPSSWAPLVVAVSKLLFLVTLTGWILAVRKEHPASGEVGR